MDIVTSGSANTDQLQLPLDVFQHVLLLLGDTDIARLRLACWSFRQAVDSQLRVLKPLYLPPSTPAAFSSCETVQAPILRYPAGSLPETDAGRSTAYDVLRYFGWQAPIRNFGSILSTMQHAGELDLSGQLLPAGCISQLAQHMTRLRSLNLDACRLTKPDLVLLTAFPAQTGAEGAGLSRLSLASVQVQASTLSTAPAQAAGKRGSTATATAAALAEGAAAAAAAAAVASDSDSAEEWPPAGAKGLREAGQVLDAIAANPLTHLEIGNMKCWDVVKAAAHHTTKAIPATAAPALSLLGRCSRLAPLASSLVSLKVLRNPFNARDWSRTICSKLTLLTELHMSWNSEDPKLSLDAEAFGSISQLQRLQSLRVDFTDPRGLSYEPYSLTPLAHSLTSLQLCGTNSLSLLLSVTDCTNIQTLVLRHIAGAAGTPEMMVQLVCSLPVLQELHLCHIEAPQLQRVGLCHLGDYLLSQLDCCAPQLTKLVMPDVDVNGTGIRSAAVASSRYAPPAPAGTAAAVGSSAAGQLLGVSPAAGPAAPGSSSGSPWELAGVGALRRLKHLELDATCLMASTLPHMSCLTGLHSLTLQNMKAAQLTQACRFDCFRFVSALTNLTALNITSDPLAALSGADGAAAAGGAAGNGQEPFLPAGMAQHMVQQLFGDEEFDEGEDGSESSEEDEDESSEGSEEKSEEGSDGVQGDEDDNEGHEGLSSEEWQDVEDESESGNEGGSEEEEEEGANPQAAPLPHPPAHHVAAVPALPPAQQGQLQLLQAFAAAAQQQPGDAGEVNQVMAALQQGLLLPQPPLQQGDPLQLMVQALAGAQPQQQQGHVGGAAGQPGGLLAAAAQAFLQQAQQQQGQLGAGGQPEGLLAVLQAFQQVIHPQAQQQPLAALQQQVAALQALHQQAVQGNLPLQQGPHQLLAAALAAGVGGAGAGGGGGGGLNPQGGVMQMAAPGARTAGRVLEPHLHFLARLKGLVSLNLGCLRTRGPCLMHLSSLSNLQTLLLSDSIHLTPSSLDLLSKLRLPSVRHLSFTGCSMDSTQGCPPRPTNEQLQARLQQRDWAPSGKSREGGSSSSRNSRDAELRAWYVWQRDQLYNMDQVVPVLCAAFPGVELLRFGTCSRLSIVGLAGLLQQLPKLQRLWLVHATGRVHPDGPMPVNFVPATAQKQRGRGRGQGQQQRAEQQQQVVGYVLPYDPRAADIGPDPPLGWQYMSQSGEELAWFVEHGVVVEPEVYSTAAAGSPVQRAASAAAGVPAGAVALPCPAVSSLKYVHIDTIGGSACVYAFARYMGRMVRC